MKLSKSLYLAFVCYAMAACASSSPFATDTFTYTPTGAATPITITGFGAWCENNLTTIRGATKATVTITANTLSVHNANAISTVIKDAKAVEVPLQGLLNQSNPPTLAQIGTALSTASVNDPSGIFASVIQPALTLGAGYITELQNEGAPAKIAIDVLTAIVNGINDAINALSPTTWFKIHTEIRPPHGSHLIASAYDLSVAKE